MLPSGWDSPRLASWLVLVLVLVLVLPLVSEARNPIRQCCWEIYPRCSPPN
jgi:hypothetical protein